MTLPAPSSDELDGALQRLGHEAFRPGQREAIETLLSQRRLLLVAPTGGGKSLTYQLPATILGGTTLVVSPLIALMQDQVSALRSRGVAATFFASTVPSHELYDRGAKAAAGEYRLIYVAPERVGTRAFRELLSHLECPLIAIDEAHCISEWGHDFRPEYLDLGELVRSHPDARVLACTATATPFVRDEIVARLGLSADTPQLVHGFARPNLVLRATETKSKKDRSLHVDAQLVEALGDPASATGAAIVYSFTRADAEREAVRLSRAGWNAEAYHAGMEGRTRTDVGDRFASGELDVVVATNAFGMGIDRADVRSVIHLAPPGSIEAYYQEVGRAGRDGATAWGLMLWSGGDVPRRRWLLENGSDGDDPNPQVIEHKWNLYLELMRWAEGGSCRHDAILRYFDAGDVSAEGCGECDVCTTLDVGDEHDEEEVTLVVRKALSAVARVHGRFGLQVAAKLLKGTDDDRLDRSGLSATRTFGALSERPETWIVQLLRRCVTAGWVTFTGGERPVVLLTADGELVMKGAAAARLVLPSERASKRVGHPARGRGRTGPVDDNLSAEDLELFEALRAHRLDVARDQGVPPYVVASDRTLRELARLKPRTRGDLLLVHGIGESKADRFGDGLLSVVSRDSV